MRLNPALIFALLLVVAVAFVMTTVAALPATVAIHFRFDGEPNGFAGRDQYRDMTLAVLVLLPLLCSAGVIWLSKKYPRALNIPNRDYWLAPERAEQTFAFLRDHSYRLGSLLIWLIAGLHWRFLEAHKSNPPHLSAATMTVVVPIFFAGVALWVAALLVRFRKPSPPTFGDDL